MKKIFTMALALGMFSMCYAENVITFFAGEGEPGVEEPPLIGLGISPSGRYATGSIDMGMGIWVGDADTGKVIYQLCIGADGDFTDEGGELRHVDDNGKAIGFTWTGMTYNFETGRTEFLYVPDEYKGSLGEDITGDGKMMVGSMLNAAGTIAGYWENDDWYTLPFPTDEELAQVSVRKQSAAKMVSYDGKHIYGCLGSFTIPCAWERQADGTFVTDFWPLRFMKNGDADEDNPDKPLYSISAMYGMGMSDNGRYMCALGLIKNEEGNARSCPVVYDTQTKTLTTYGATQEIDPNGEGLWPTSICNDGSIVGTVGQPVFRSAGSFFLKAGSQQAQLFRDIFPEFNKIYGESDRLGFALPTDMSSSGHRILCYTYYSDDYMDTTTPAYYESFIIENEFCDPTNGVEEIASAEEADAVPAAYYDVNGRRVNGLQEGMTIVRMSDGSSRKVMK